MLSAKQQGDTEVQVIYAAVHAKSCRQITMNSPRDGQDWSATSDLGLNAAL